MLLCPMRGFVDLMQVMFFKHKVKGLLHERGFTIEEKDPTFYAMLHAMKWGPLV